MTTNRKSELEAQLRQKRREVEAIEAELEAEAEYGDEDEEHTRTKYLNVMTPPSSTSSVQPAYPGSVQPVDPDSVQPVEPESVQSVDPDAVTPEPASPNPAGQHERSRFYQENYLPYALADLLPNLHNVFDVLHRKMTYYQTMRNLVDEMAAATAVPAMDKDNEDETSAAAGSFSESDAAALHRRLGAIVPFHEIALKEIDSLERLPACIRWEEDMARKLHDSMTQMPHVAFIQRLRDKVVAAAAAAAEVEREEEGDGENYETEGSEDDELPVMAQAA